MATSSPLPPLTPPAVHIRFSHWLDGTVGQLFRVCSYSTSMLKSERYQSALLEKVSVRKFVTVDCQCSWFFIHSATTRRSLRFSSSRIGHALGILYWRWGRNLRIGLGGANCNANLGTHAIGAGRIEPLKGAGRGQSLKQRSTGEAIVQPDCLETNLNQLLEPSRGSSST